MSSLQFLLITPEKTAMDESIYEVILPTKTGQIAVLPGHMPLVTLLQPGVISIRRQKNDNDEQLMHLATSGGFVEVAGGAVKVMADSADRADDLDELKVEEAKDEAKRQRDSAADDVAYADAVGRLEFELAKLRVLNLKRRHRRN